MALALTCGMPSVDSAQSQQAAPAEIAAMTVNRFDGSAQFKGKNGASKNAHVTIQQLTIPPKQSTVVAPKQAFLLVTVRAGKVTATIGDKREQHSTDDFWTVPENGRMSVEAGGEAAIIEVISFTVR